jgi:hypothetical protein
MKTLYRTAVLGSVLLLGAAVFTAGAQSNEVIDRLLEEEEASFARALYLVQSAAGRIEERVPPGKAYAGFDAGQWNLEDAAADEEITLGQYSQLLMRALEIPGGIMYRILPGPRYAARELEYLGFVRGSGAPGRPVSGSEVMYILGRALQWKEDR